MDDMDLASSHHPSVLSTLYAYGVTSGDVRLAHGDARPPGSFTTSMLTRAAREEFESERLAPAATKSAGAGSRLVEEEPDMFALCFEEDLDRIKTSTAFRRLAGKCQVFVAPRNDMLRNRLTHVIEVAHVATRVSASLGLNMALTEAIALGHDCGHGPGGHPAEEAFSPYLPEGFDHAVWGANEVLVPLNLCAETLDGVRNHSWKRPSPATAEGAVVAWADRIAYVCHDWNDAVRAGVIAQESLPPIIAQYAGSTQSDQLRFFINELIHASADNGTICMRQNSAEVLDAFRSHNFANIYLRPAALEQSEKVVAILSKLVDFYVASPNLIPDALAGKNLYARPGSEAAARQAVTYVATMTDRYAFTLAADLLGLPASALPTSA